MRPEQRNSFFFRSPFTKKGRDNARAMEPTSMEEDHETTTAGEVREEERDVHPFPSSSSGGGGTSTRPPSAWNDDFLYNREEITYMNQELRPQKPEDQKSLLCCCGTDQRSSRFTKSVRRTLHLLNVSPRKKGLIMDRYVQLVEAYALEKSRYTKFYNSLRCLTTVCGILTPALVSVQPLFGADTTANPVYWTTFSTSFTLALLNGIISLYKIDKKYASSTKAYLSLETIGWQYFSLVGPFSQQSETDPPATHSNQFGKFMARIEEIRKTESQTEYSGGNEERGGTQNSSSSMDIRGGGTPPAAEDEDEASPPSARSSVVRQETA